MSKLEIKTSKEIGENYLGFKERLENKEISLKDFLLEIDVPDWISVQSLKHWLQSKLDKSNLALDEGHDVIPNLANELLGLLEGEKHE